MAIAPTEPALKEAGHFMEEALAELLPEPMGPQSRLIDAMRYATLEGGKRVRAFMALQSGRLFGVDRRALSRVAAAVCSSVAPISGDRSASVLVSRLVFSRMLAIDA